MVYNFNINPGPDRNSVVHIHKFVSIAAIFTFIISSLTYLFFQGFPIIAIGFFTIAARPSWIVFAVKPVYLPPHRRAFIGTEIIFYFFTEITRRSFKFISALGTYLFDSISRTLSPCWAFIITLSRTIFFIIADKGIERLFTNEAIPGFRSVVIFTPHFIKLPNKNEIDTDYYNAAMKRLKDFQLQGELF